MESKGNLPEAFGVMKPVGYVLISFPTAPDMTAAAAALGEAGFASTDMVRFSPEEMKRQAQTDIDNAGILASIGQELNLVKAHLQLAEQGFSFLAVHAPEDEQAQQVARIAERFHASRAQSYGRLLIEELIEVGSDQRQVAESPDRGIDPQTYSGVEGAANPRR